MWDLGIPCRMVSLLLLELRVRSWFFARLPRLISSVAESMSSLASVFWYGFLIGEKTLRSVVGDWVLAWTCEL